MQDEIELKLALSPEDLRRLRRHPLVRSLARGRASTKTFISTYYDTPHHELRDKHIALRVRQIGHKRVQTLKIPAAEGNHATKHYLEFEAEVEGERPNPALVDDEALQAKLTANGLSERLEPAFTTTFKRTAIPIRFADSELELALDDGEIAAGERRAPICEAELELISGQPTRIYELALALGERIGFRLERRTKGARGYALIEEVKPAAVKANAVALTPKMTARAAFELAMRSCIAQIAANEAVVQGGKDHEGVHQLRVGVRRLRALVAAFRQILHPDALAYLREELSWLQQSLGGAREWDVFIDETLVPLVRRLPRVAGLAELETQARIMRERAYETARAALVDPRYTCILLRLDLWLEDGGWMLEGAPGIPAPCDSPIPCMASEVLDKRDKRLRKLSRRHDELSETEMHGIRLLAKKKRYCLEALSSLYPRKSVAGALDALKSIQDSLGTYNDAFVGGGLLDQIEEAMGPKAMAPLQQAAAAVRGWQAATMEHDMAAFRETWSHYEAGRRFWRR